MSERTAFVDEMLAWLNEDVVPKGVSVGPDTPLFAGRLLAGKREPPSCGTRPSAF